MIRRVRRIWRILGISIFEGRRSKHNLKIISYIAIVLEIPSLFGTLTYFFTPLWDFALGCFVYAIFNAITFYLAAIKKNREATVKVGVVFTLLACTNIALFARNGFAAHWTLLFPLIISYLFSVRLGIISSAFMSLLFMILYWTPLRAFFPWYPPIFLNRFPLLYIVVSLNTIYIMTDYHINILQQQLYAKKLERARDKAEEANHAKSDFLASMSHEIRTPLNAVLGINTIIQRDCEQAMELIKGHANILTILENIIANSGNIESAGNNLLSLINQILDFSKIEAGKIELSEDNYKLSSVLNDISSIMAMKAKSKDLKFNVKVDENLPDVYLGDEMRIRLILQNILTNAVKYTDRGSVSFFVNQANSEAVQSGENLLLKFVIKDTGIGVKKEDLNRIFRRFERVNLEHNSTIEGTGLGLSIVKLLCEKMGGKIKIESEYGKGTLFTVIMPQKVISCEPVGNFHEKFENTLMSKEHYHELFQAPDARVLIVDDTKFNLVVAIGLLKNTKIHIDTASSGAEAVALASERPYDLIFMDQRMPGIDGTEALHMIRKFNKTTPVICLTADAISGAKSRYLSHGFTNYLSKPIDSTELEKMLLKYLPSEKIITREQIEKIEIETADPEDEVNDFAKLKAAGIHTEVGLRYCQKDPALYRTLLNEYLMSADERFESLKKFCEAQDCDHYGIVVHTLKSSSRTIGATELSQACAQLEKAANDGDIAMIKNRTPALLEFYKKIIDGIRAADVVESDSPSKINTDDEILEFFPQE